MFEEIERMSGILTTFQNATREWVSDTITSFASSSIRLTELFERYHIRGVFDLELDHMQVSNSILDAIETKVLKLMTLEKSFRQAENLLVKVIKEKQAMGDG